MRYILSAFIALFLFLQTFFSASNVAYCNEVVYYSIHLASFKNLNNANTYVNTLSEKGKVVFWKLTDVPEKGEYYRVYLGKYNEKEKAIEFWKKLKMQGAVSYFGIHQFKEVIQSTPIVEIPEETTFPDSGIQKSKAMKSIEPSIKEGRFVDNHDGTITDKQTNLMWIKNGWRIDFVSAVKWKEAMDKCTEFKLGGYSDWRLPSIQEWKSLIDSNKEYPALVEPNPFENLIVHMPYWSKSEYNYGNNRSGSSRVPSQRVYTVMLYYGRVNHQSVDKRAFILPVRTIE